VKSSLFVLRPVQNTQTQCEQHVKVLNIKLVVQKLNECGISEYRRDSVVGTMTVLQAG
jgi:hypothetical protein